MHGVLLTSFAHWVYKLSLSFSVVCTRNGITKQDMSQRVVTVIWHTVPHIPGQHTCLQHNFLHFLIRRLELSNEDQHDFTSVVVGVLGVHERDEVTNGLQEGSQTLQHTSQYQIQYCSNKYSACI